MTEKLIGYLLLVIGVVVILVSAFSVYQVLTAKAQPAVFVKPGPSVLNIPITVAPGLPPVNIPLELDKILPVMSLTNTFIHLMLMGFLVNVGFRLASLGTSLVRPIVIRTKEV